jgi:hypothetical protein
MFNLTVVPVILRHFLKLFWLSYCYLFRHFLKFDPNIFGEFYFDSIKKYSLPAAMFLEKYGIIKFFVIKNNHVFPNAQYYMIERFDPIDY